jgi:DNA-binding transcriptional MerR regulator
MTDGPITELPKVTQPEKPVSPKPPEVKVPEKPIGQDEQKIIERIDKDGNPDQVLEDIAGGQTPTETGKTTLQQFLDTAAENEKTPIVGGEIISPTAIKVGETSSQPAQERGWLSAITNAHGKQDVPIADRQKNVQEIVDAAIAAGVPREKIGEHLKSLGITAVPREQAATQSATGTPASESNKNALSEERVRAYLSEITLQIPKVKEGSLTQVQLQAVINEAKAAGVPVDRIKSALEAQGVNVVPAQENKSQQSTPKATEQPVQEKTKPETTEVAEGIQAFQQQIESFLRVVSSDPALQRTLRVYREKTKTTETDMQILAKMAQSMYEVIHKSGMPREALVDSLHASNVDEYIQTFDSENPQRLRERVASTSKVRQITEQELIDGGQPDQAAGFVWFKGNAPRPPNAREVRFYINASPEGTLTVAEKLAKISDQLDQYGMRLQFKFRKDFEEYTRTDTCVAYLYMPETTTPKQKAISDQWLGVVKDGMGRLPKDALRPQSSFFTNQLAEGVSFVEDTRDESGKKGESYTSRITKTIAETCGELAGQYDSLTPEAMQAISARAATKLRQLNYI